MHELKRSCWLGPGAPGQGRDRPGAHPRGHGQAQSGAAQPTTAPKRGQDPHGHSSGPPQLSIPGLLRALIPETETVEGEVLPKEVVLPGCVAEGLRPVQACGCAGLLHTALVIQLPCILCAADKSCFARCPCRGIFSALAALQAARAVAACLTPGLPPLMHVSIQPRGQHMSRMTFLPQVPRP